MKRLGFWASSLALLLMGCGKTGSDPGTPADTSMAGATNAEQRLVPWQLWADGTAPLDVGLYDTKLEVACEYLTASDGKLRCLPMQRGQLELTREFADPECRKPLYLGGQPPALAQAVEQALPVTVPLVDEGCEQRFGVAVLEQLADEAQHYAGTSCTPASSGIPTYLGKVHNYTVVEPRDVAGYATGKALDSDAGILDGRVSLRRIEYATDRRIHRGFIDEIWGLPCRLSELRGSLSCLPDSISDNTNLFVDAVCKGESLWRSEACFEPAYIGTYNELRELGEPWTGAVFENGKGCREWTGATISGDRFYAGGEPLGADAVAALEWAAEGAGRLRLLTVVDAEGILFPIADATFDASSLRGGPGQSRGPRYHDSEADRDCTPVWTTDSGVRCVPDDAIIDPFSYETFKDPDCSEPVYLCLIGECVGKDVVVMDFDAAGMYRGVSRRVAKALDENVAYSPINGMCTSRPAEGSVFDLGEELPWDDYPELTEDNGPTN